MEPSSSPLHASFLESSKLRPSPRFDHLEHTTDLSSPSFPASGAGSPSFGAEPRGTRSLSNGRRTRRLHLRNAGFRGPNVPGRRVTPANTSSTATTTTWSAGQTSDIENISPTGRKKMYEEDNEEMNDDWNRTDRRGSGAGVLQDIVNSAPSRRARPRVSSAKLWTNADASETATFAALDNNISSPPQPASSTTKSRSLRAKAKLSKRRRSASREAREYIEHLEGVLATTLEQLDIATSSTSAQEQSDKLRRMNAEMQRIHEEMAGLEATFDERVNDELEEARQREKELQAKVSSLEAQLKDAKKPVTNLYAANPGKWQFERFELLEAQLQSTREALVSAEARIDDLQRQNDRLHTLLADSAISPSQANPRANTPALGRRTRPTSIVPTAGSLAMSPGGFSQTYPGSPFSPRGVPGGPASPLASVFSPEVLSSDGNESDNSMRTSIIHPPDTVSRRQKYMRQFKGTETEPLLLPDRSLAGQTQRSSMAESSDFTFPPNEQADGSPKVHHRRSLTRSIIEKAPSRTPSGLTINTNIKPDVNTSLLKSPDFTSFEDNSRHFSTSTTDSTVGRSLGRNLYDELSAVRTFSTSTGNEQYPSELAQDENSDIRTLPTVIRSSPFDSNVAELPDASDNDENKVASTAAPGLTGTTVNRTVPSAGSAASSSLVAERQYGPIMAQVVHHNRRVSSVSHLVAARASLGMRSQASIRAASQASDVASSQASIGSASQKSLSTLDSYRTVFSNLYRTPLDVVKHLAQTTAATMSIPRSILSSILSIPHWLFDIFLAPMLRRARAMLGRPSPSSSREQQPLLQDAASPCRDGLTYGTAYQTPESSPSTVSTSSNSMVAGTGKKRASSMSTKNAGALTVVGAGIAARDPDDQTRRWKHSPLLWFKFTVCLAFAVGEAFKRGPGNVLKEAHKSKKGKAGNWRKANRGEPYTPSL